MDELTLRQSISIFARYIAGDIVIVYFVFKFIKELTSKLSYNRHFGDDFVTDLARTLSMVGAWLVFILAIIGNLDLTVRFFRILFNG